METERPPAGRLQNLAGFERRRWRIKARASTRDPRDEGDFGAGTYRQRGGRDPSRLWQPSGSLWLRRPGQPCRYHLRRSGRAWPRAVTAQAGDPRPAEPSFTVDLDRAAAPRQAWSSLAISWAVGGIGRARLVTPRPYPPFPFCSSPAKPLAPSHFAAFLPSLPPCPQPASYNIQLCLLDLGNQKPRR